MLEAAVKGTRVQHKILGKGTIVNLAVDPHFKTDFNELKICSVEFDSLKEGYSNPFTVDWESLEEI